MTVLWFGFGLMLLLACALLMLPVLRSGQVKNGELLTGQDDEPLSREELNTAIYSQRLSELEADLASERLMLAQFEELKSELDKTLLEEVSLETSDNKSLLQGAIGHKKLALVFAVFPITALAFYALHSQNAAVPEWVALSQKLDPAIERVLAKDPDAIKAFEDHSSSDFVRVLQSYLQSGKGSAEGWYMLGGTYAQVKLYEPAKQAFRKAYDMDSSELSFGLAYAQSLLALSDGVLERESARLLNELIRDFPDNQQLQMLFGMAAFRSEQYGLAIKHWQGILNQTQRDASDDFEKGRQVLQNSIALARQRMAEQGASKSAAAEANMGSVTAAQSLSVPEVPTIQVEVELGEGIAAQLQGDETLFVLARAMSGPPIPLAARKIPLSQVTWPLRLELSDVDAMMPQLKLSSFELVKVIARISRGGQPIAQSGDWYGEFDDVATDKVSLVAISIDKTVP